MRPFDRVLLFIYSFCLTIILVIIALWGAGWISAPYFLLWENNLLLDSRGVFIFLGLFILIGIRLFWVSIKPERKKQIIVQEGALGKVRIAIPAIENLVEKTVAQNSGVREIKAQVTTVPQGIGIKMRATVTPDVQIPEISKVIQEKVKEKVLEITGITVQEVSILISSIAAKKLRVE
ncbi:MAG TPA: alkaline shock response membrane anchor protein AmaP [Desulfotomaculum sp.]|nr:alkaline shock response membrane anchor protein AmaP [Desulfotomaculum sp.]